ncbi:hypothetical protein HanPI659440_Chr03g0129031 [Helianthus annuus]|nr:hypothetical protein HanPI659440_Chr03g0129031 [Helianthus annuus]
MVFPMMTMKLLYFMVSNLSISTHILHKTWEKERENCFNALRLILRIRVIVFRSLFWIFSNRYSCVISRNLHTQPMISMMQGI